MDEADINIKIYIYNTHEVFEVFKLPTVSETSCHAWKLQISCAFLVWPQNTLGHFK